MSASIAPSRTRRLGPPGRTWAASRDASTTSASSTTRSVLIALSRATPRRCSTSPHHVRTPRSSPQVEYPPHFEVCRVSRNGGIRWKHNSIIATNNGWLNVSSVLAEEYVGLEEIHDGIWALYFGPLLLGRFDERTKKLSGNLRSMKAATPQLSPMSSDY